MNNINTQKITDKLKKIISTRLTELNWSQQKLADKTGIAQPTISKLLTGNSVFSLNQLIKISSAIDINLFGSINTTDLNLSSVTPLNFPLPIEESDSLIINATRQAFKGYINNNYNIYFLSTVSGATEIITGTISFSMSQSDSCDVNLIIYTGKKDLLGNSITKNYSGTMIISIPMSTCYCPLINIEIGELCFLEFHHMFLFNEQMVCRVGAALTVSSGENRRPTMHRLIISDYKFDINNENDKDFLFGQLRLNNKKILINEEDLSEILKRYNNKKISETITKTQANIIELDENNLLAMDLDIKDKIALINILRSKSYANKNNKISTNTDEFLYEYIKNKSNS